MYHHSGNIPHHQYVFVHSSYVSNKSPCEWLPAVWFGLVSVPGRMWGLNVMLECGAVYRNVPPQAIAFEPTQDVPEWSPFQAQRWDCYGHTFSTLEYTYLRGLSAVVRCCSEDRAGDYLFTAVPIDDGFSRHPSQSKEFMFMRLNNGRLTIQPTDKVVFKDSSFTKTAWPTHLKRNETVYSCEV
jgi:hypothetical protein